MSARLRRILFNVALFAITFGVVAVVVLAVRGDDVDRAKGDDRVLSVNELLRRPSHTRTAVRGFVFIDARTGTLLCSARRGSPPVCDGKVVRLDGLDHTRLDLDRSNAPHTYDAWTADAVDLLGEWVGGLFLVDDIL
jgi:hypothetical protein